MNAALQLLEVWSGAAILMTWGWFRQQRTNNAGIVDVLWALGLGASALWLAATGSGAALPRTLLGILAGLWGVRLAAHLWRRVSREPEDGRYRYLRAHWQGNQLKFFGFFQFQALLVALFALPFLAVAHNPEGELTGWTLAALSIWVASVGGEALADRQLSAFRSDPANRGRTCRAGLWRYSRHPNYFFEWLHWLSYVSLSVGAPFAWLSGTGPLLMYVFLRWVSGIPFTEAQALRTRGDDYRMYQQQTNMFFPWFPKQAAASGRQENDQ
jgi:steroid 5-alpha reductase family enzyme